MIEQLLTSGGLMTPADPTIVPELIVFQHETVIDFLSRFSAASVNGVTILPGDPRSQTGIEVLDFAGTHGITLNEINAQDNPFNINDGDRFVLETWLSPRVQTQQMLYSNLVNATGSGTLLTNLNNTFEVECLVAFDVNHVSQTNADRFGTTRYRFGLGQKFPIDTWTHLRIACDAQNISCSINKEHIGTMPWHGAVKPVNNGFKIGSTVDNQLQYNGLMDGFRFLKW